MDGSEGNSDAVSPHPWQSYNTVYTTAKAGMEGVDKEKVQRVVYEMSKGSKYFQNEERKEAFIKQKIDDMRLQFAKLSQYDLSHYQKVAERRILELEASRDLSRIWLHVDMDAFYAAVETLSDRTLKGKPMAVGSVSMLSTANYEARKFGVRSAMPGFIARKLCPELILVPTDFKKYTHYSDLTRKVFQRYDPNFVAGSLDEAYLDITEVCRERNVKSEEIAQELRDSVHEETGLTCSAGVAPNRLLAKNNCSLLKFSYAIEPLYRLPLYLQFDNTLPGCQHITCSQKLMFQERGWWKDIKNQKEMGQRRIRKRWVKEETRPTKNHKPNLLSLGKDEKSQAKPPISRKRPAFQEKKIIVDLGDGNPAATVAVRSSQIDHPPKREEKRSNPYHMDRAYYKDKALSRERQRGNGGFGNSRERQGYLPSKTQTQKLKHDLYHDVNKDPIPLNEDDQIAKLEALLAS